MKKKTTLSASVLQALALGGVDASAVAEPGPGDSTTTTTPAAKAEVPVVTATTPVVEDVTNTPEDTTDASGAATDTAVLEATGGATNELTTYLRAELSEARTALAAATAELSSLKPKLTQAEADVTTLTACVDKVVKRLAVPLNATLTGYDNASPEGKAQVFEELNAALSKRFPVGGVSHSTADAQAGEHGQGDNVVQLSGRDAAAFKASSLKR